MSENKKQQLVPRVRFPEFRAEDGWGSEFGNMIFDQISNKDHNSDLPVLAITQEQGAIPREMIDYHVSVTDKSLESYKVVEVGDFIISLRSFQGGIEFSRYRGICSPAYVILRLRHGHSEDYFRHYLKTGRFIAQMTKNLEGLRDGKMISYKQFSELELPIPQRGEQQKIADCLSSLDELITAETQKLDTLKTHKKGLMQQLFPREGETVPRLRFPEFREAPAWGKEKLEKLITTVSPPSKLQSSNYGTQGKFPIIDQSQEFICGWTDDERAVITESLPLIIFGDHTCALKFVDKPFAQGADGIKILKVRPAISAEYLFHSLSHRPLAMEDYKRHFSMLKERAVVFPDIESGEQQKIADCLSSLDDLITAQTQKIDALKTHKKGLMQQLFPTLDEVDA